MKEKQTDDIVTKIFDDINNIFRACYKKYNSNEHPPFPYHGNMYSHFESMNFQGRFTVNELWGKMFELRKKYIGDKK